MAGRSRRVPTAVMATVVVGLVLTAVVAWAAWAAYDDNEDRITERRTREAAAVLSAAIPGVELPLAATATLAVDEDGDGAPDAAFERVAASQVGPDRRFLSISAWRPGDTAPVLVLGEAPKLLTRPSSDIRAALDGDGGPGPHIVGLQRGEDPRLGYATAGEGFVVYAEQALPPDRTSVVQPDSAFSGLDYALYLGAEERDDQLLFASTADLPITGRRAAESIPFGDTSLLLVMTPTEELAGALLAALPWIVAGTGVAVTAAAGLLVHGLARGRSRAESLARENARLYDQQRDVAHTLQQSLLPSRLPELEDVEIAVRYVAGVAGTEVGGDWYDVLHVDRRLVVVVGDVSGRGVGAAAVMAGLRYSLRTLAARTPSITAVLDDLGTFDTVERDGHFATVLAACIDLDGATVTFANAGHPPPILVAGGEATLVDTPVGPPVGVPARRPYEGRTVRLSRDAMLLLVTDGLFERRGETVDVGLERLRDAAAAAADGTPAQVLDAVVSSLDPGEAGDDAVLLAIRWRR